MFKNLHKFNIVIAREMPKYLKVWLMMIFTGTVLIALVYTAVQQNMRTFANDPQIQISQDIANAMIHGANPQDLAQQGNIDITKSLAPFAIIFDASGKVLSSSGSINGQPPVPPHGVFDYANLKGEDRFTWQPQPGISIAAVLTKFEGTSQQNSGYVLAGKNLLEIEKRESSLALYIMATWLVLALGGLVFSMCLFKQNSNSI